MTIIAAAYDSPTSYAIAADSHAEVNGNKIPRVKVARFGSLLIGGTGYTRDAALLNEYLTNCDDPLTGDLSKTLRAAWAYVLTETDRKRDVCLDSSWLAVNPAGVWILSGDGLVTTAPRRWALGCGEDIGIGAMYQRQGRPSQVVRFAVEAAIHFRSGCHGEAHVFWEGE